MHRFTRIGLVTIFALTLARPSLAQAADPSGHWEGALVLPTNELPFQIDLGPNTEGALAGTISIPLQQIKGLPLSTVRLDGKTVTFSIVGNGGGTFTGVIAGTTIEGDFSGAQGSTTFQLKRTGDARLDGPLKGPALPAALEGSWMGILRAEGREMHIRLIMKNGADGRSLAHAISLDEGGLDLPVAISDASPATLLFTVPITGMTYSGTVKGDRGEIEGTYEQRGLKLPLTFVHEPTP
jgi:hypothetical protein